MAQDLDEDARATADAPAGWSEAMAQAALETGLAVETPGGPSIARGIERVAARVADWAGDDGLAADLRRLLEAAKVMFDPPLVRAALAPGAELALSAALIHWPAARADEMEALARAQTLLAAGAKLGIAGAPSAAALDALDAAARIADPTGAEGAAILVRPEADAAPRLIADASARLRASTGNGTISADFPITVQGRLNDDIDTVLGRGGPTIDVRTANGSLRIGRVR